MEIQKESSASLGVYSNTQIFLEPVVTHPLHCLSWWDAVSRFRTISTMSSGKSALAILSEGM